MLSAHYTHFQAEGCSTLALRPAHGCLFLLLAKHLVVPSCILCRHTRCDSLSHGVQLCSCVCVTFWQFELKLWLTCMPSSS